MFYDDFALDGFVGECRYQKRHKPHELKRRERSFKILGEALMNDMSCYEFIEGLCYQDEHTSRWILLLSKQNYRDFTILKISRCTSFLI